MEKVVPAQQIILLHSLNAWDTCYKILILLTGRFLL